MATPTAIRSSKTLKYLPESWQIHVLSGQENAALDRATTHFAKTWYPVKLLTFLKAVKLTKFLEWLIWPDDDIFWLLPAVFKGRKVIQENNLDLIIVFLKPYSAGLVGILLKFLTGRPLIINVCEPSTCDDLYAVFPTKLHYYLDRWLEDFYVRQADAIIYVSQLSLDLVRARQPQKYHSRFHLLRGGADPYNFAETDGGNPSQNTFDIVFTGGMTGWDEFLEEPQPSLLKKLRFAWMKLGQYRNVKVHPASSSPVYIGKAIQQLFAKYPDWQGKIKLQLYGNKFARANEVLEKQNLLDVVEVTGPLPHTEAVLKLQEADLLFMPLPDRIDETPGDRISLKTYEYLMTNRPILAAVPQGENQNYLADKPGVHLVAPFDVEGMAQVIDELFSSKLAGQPSAVDRSVTQAQISYVKRGEELAALISDVLRGLESKQASEQPLEGRSAIKISNTSSQQKT